MAGDVVGVGGAVVDGDAVGLETVGGADGLVVGGADEALPWLARAGQIVWEGYIRRKRLGSDLVQSSPNTHAVSVRSFDIDGG